MATSAFRSTSRRGTAEPKAPPPSRRRSHSVSAASRKTHLPFDEFSNSRDNPLFWAAPSSSSSPPEKEENGRKTSQIDHTKQKLNSSRRTSIDSYNSSSVSEERGRSVTRSNGGAKNGIGRSLSRVRVYQSEKEQGVPSRNDVKQASNGVNKTNSVRKNVATRDHSKNARPTSTVWNQETDWSEDDSACSLQISNLDNGISTGSLSEAEEKTINAICEDFDVYRRNNVNIGSSPNIIGVPPELVNPESVDLMSDIRREYATKLEESEERARKLRTNLAIEEHRRQELDRIIKETQPDPKPYSVPRSRQGRKTSNERKRMSRRLTEEAMSYFDECVSLSTFDSSDFSAPEDPLFRVSGANIHASASSLVKGNIHHKQLCGESGMMTINNSSSMSESGSAQVPLPYDFSFDNKHLQGDFEPYEDMRSYIKHFERGSAKDIDSRSYYDAGEYSMRGHAAESVLIDRVMYNNRMESGGLLLCGGSFSFLHFA